MLVLVLMLHPVVHQRQGFNLPPVQKGRILPHLFLQKAPRLMRALVRNRKFPVAHDQGRTGNIGIFPHVPPGVHHKGTQLTEHAARAGTFLNRALRRKASSICHQLHLGAISHHVVVLGQVLFIRNLDQIVHAQGVKVNHRANAPAQLGHNTPSLNILDGRTVSQLVCRFCGGAHGGIRGSEADRGARLVTQALAHQSIQAHKGAAQNANNLIEVERLNSRTLGGITFKRHLPAFQELKERLRWTKARCNFAPIGLGTNRLVKLVKEHQANFAGIGSLIVRDLRQAVAHAGTAPALARHGGDIEHEQFEPRGICHGLDGVGFPVPVEPITKMAAGERTSRGSAPRANITQRLTSKLSAVTKASKLPSWPITL